MKLFQPEPTNDMKIHVINTDVETGCHVAYHEALNLERL